MSEIEHEEQEQIKQRRSKLNELRENGIAFPTDFRRNVIAGEVLAEYGEKGETIASGEFTGLATADAVAAIARALESRQLGGLRVQWRLRDWGISRQRYWG